MLEWQSGRVHLRRALRFDWQQSCMNNIGQEWAWNWHFLEPEFLDKNEDRRWPAESLTMGVFVGFPCDLGGCMRMHALADRRP